jgi:hypothetical protein
MPSGERFIATYNNGTIINSFVSTPSGAVEATKTNTTYVMANGAQIHVGATRSALSFGRGVSPENDWFIEIWIQINGGTVDFNRDVAVSTGSLETVNKVRVNFSDQNGTLHVPQLANGTYPLSGQSGDTFTVVNGVVAEGQANFLCYASIND